jgi:hypothetical protein
MNIYTILCAKRHKLLGTHIPDVVKILIEKNYYADGRVNPKAA